MKTGGARHGAWGAERKRIVSHEERGERGGWAGVSKGALGRFVQLCAASGKLMAGNAESQGIDEAMTFSRIARFSAMEKGMSTGIKRAKWG
jgi:hypothetical protein